MPGCGGGFHSLGLAAAPDRSPTSLSLCRCAGDRSPSAFPADKGAYLSLDMLSFRFPPSAVVSPRKQAQPCAVRLRRDAAFQDPDDTASRLGSCLRYCVNSPHDSNHKAGDPERSGEGLRPGEGADSQAGRQSPGGTGGRGRRAARGRSRLAHVEVLTHQTCRLAGHHLHGR